MVVDPPFRGEPDVDRSRQRTEPLLDPAPGPDALHLGVHDPGVLVDLAEEILAVDELERPTPEVLKPQAEPIELLLLAVSHEPDDFDLVVVAGVREAFPDTAPASGPRDDEVHLREVEHCRVVEVGHELVREERSDPRVPEQEVVRRLHGLRRREPIRQPIVEHLTKQLQVRPVLPGQPGDGRRHDVRRRVEAVPAGERVRHDLVEHLDVEVPGGQLSDRATQQFPRFDPIEEFEEQDPEDDLFRGLVAVVGDVADHVLTYSVGRPVRVRKPVSGQNWIPSPGPRLPPDSAVEDVLSQCGEPPV